MSGYIFEHLHSRLGCTNEKTPYMDSTSDANTLRNVSPETTGTGLEAPTCFGRQFVVGKLQRGRRRRFFRSETVSRLISALRFPAGLFIIDAAMHLADGTIMLSLRTYSYGKWFTDGRGTSWCLPCAEFSEQPCEPAPIRQ
jgi:hypothetical protein